MPRPGDLVPRRPKSKRLSKKFGQSLVSGALLFFAIVWLLNVDRSRLLDFYSYADYFLYSHPDSWRHIFEVRDTGPLASAVYFTEEFIWRLYTWLLGSFLSPELAVSVTMCLISTLIFFAARKTDRPVAAFLLWILIPVGISIVGLYQLRQGLAFAVFAMLATQSRPILGSLMAASIHSTFAFIVPACLLLQAKDNLPGVFRRLPDTLIATTLIVSAVVTATVGVFLFENYGGRRVATYDPTQTSATSIFYAVGMAIFAAHYLALLLSSKQKSETCYLRAPAAAGLFIATFCAASFFIFPLGTMRFGYLPFLLTVLTLTHKSVVSIAQFRLKPAATVIHLGAILFLLYQFIISLIRGEHGFSF